MTTQFTRRLAVAALATGLVIGVPAAANATSEVAPAPAPAAVAAEPAVETTVPTRREQRVTDREDRAEQRAQDRQERADNRAEDRAQRDQERAERKQKMTMEATAPTSQYGEVTVTGRGFPKKQEITVMISNGSDIHAVGVTFVGANGRFSIDLMPSQPWHTGTYQVWVGYPGGTHEIEMTIDDSLPSSGATALSATVPSGPNDSITLSGTDFAPETTLRVFVQADNSSILPISTEATTDANGSFTVTATPSSPWSPETTYLVSAQDTNGQRIKYSFRTPAW